MNIEYRLVVLLVFSEGALVGCALPSDGAPRSEPAEVDLATSEQGLYRTGAPFPGRTVPVCWNDSIERADFAQFGPRAEAAIMRSWTQATGLRFVGWGPCPSDTRGSIAARLIDSDRATAHLGYSPDRATGVDLGVQRGDFETAAIHEFGHALGHAHEMSRPGFVGTGACAEAESLCAFGTRA